MFSLQCICHISMDTPLLVPVFTSVADNDGWSYKRRCLQQPENLCCEQQTGILMRRRIAEGVGDQELAEGYQHVWRLSRRIILAGHSSTFFAMA